MRAKLWVGEVVKRKAGFFAFAATTFFWGGESKALDLQFSNSSGLSDDQVWVTFEQPTSHRGSFNVSLNGNAVTDSAGTPLGQSTRLFSRSYSIGEINQAGGAFNFTTGQSASGARVRRAPALVPTQAGIEGPLVESVQSPSGLPITRWLIDVGTPVGIAPIPEPATVQLLIGLGLATLLIRMLRRRHS